MPAHKTPTALRELKGMDKKNPSRRNDEEPEVVNGIGEAPNHFDEGHQKIWDEIVGISYQGVLGDADRMSLEVMCKLMFRFRWGSAEEDSTTNPLSGVELNKLCSLLSEFGMTPSSRSKIVVPKQKPKGGFASL
jgi:phage terminase small subunit